MKINKFIAAAMAVVVISGTVSIQRNVYSEETKLLAFPGAEGGGKYTEGARAGGKPEVYHVTNLNDSGTGSLRDGISKSGRIIVFDVGGVINLKSQLQIKENTTILGQTAPEAGITITQEYDRRMTKAVSRTDWAEDGMIM